MYRLLRVFESTLDKTLCYVNTLNVCHDALNDVSVMYERFQTGRVNVHAVVLN